MVNYDAFERMSGSTYFGIMDFDEFLIPSRNRTLKEMLVRIWFFFTKFVTYTYLDQNGYSIFNVYKGPNIIWVKCKVTRLYMC